MNRPMLPRPVDCALLTLGPLFFLLSGQFQLFPWPGWVDAGIYLGYQFDFPTIVERFGIASNSYHGTRLSWVYPGYLLHRLFAPDVAQIVQVAVQLLLAIGSAWVIGARFGGRVGGTLAAASLAFNPQFFAAASVGGVDGITVGYCLLGAAALFASSGYSIRQGVLFGVASACAATAHPFAIAMGGLLALAKWMIDRPDSWRALAVFFFSALFSALLCVGGFGLLAQAYGLKFLYFMDSLPMAQLAVKGIGANYRIPFDQWGWGAYRLLAPLAVIVVMCAVLPFQRAGQRRPLLGALLCLAFSCALFPIYDWLAGGSIVQLRVYTNLTIPAMVLAFAVLTGTASTPHTATRSALASILLLALPAALACWHIGQGGSWANTIGSAQALAAGCILLFALAGIGLIWHARAPRAMTGVAPSLLALALLTCGALNLDSIKVYRHYTGISFKDVYDAAAAVKHELTPALHSPKRLLMLYNRDSFTIGNAQADERAVYKLRFADTHYRFSVYDTISSLFVYDRTMLTGNMPNIDLATYQGMVPNKAIPLNVAILSQSELEYAATKIKLQQVAGVPLREIRKVDFHRGTIRFSMWLLDFDPADQLNRKVDGCEIKPKTQCAQANLSSENLDNTQLESANLERANLNNASFSGARLSNAVLSGASLVGATLAQSALDGAKIDGANLTRVNAAGANLPKTDLRRANLSRADFARANLYQSNLSGVQALSSDFTAAAMEGAQLDNANFSRSDFSAAKLASTNFSASVLTSANFDGANLAGANLSRTQLPRANLSSANLTGADLRDANLDGADLRNANLTDAKLAGARFSNTLRIGCIGCPK